MVKIGFICEGKTETLLIASANFQAYLSNINLQCVNVIDAKGNGNLLPHNIEPFVNSLTNLGATKIFIITDLDEDACITKTKQRIDAKHGEIIVVAVQQIEAWFLANTAIMQTLLKDENFSLEFPEKEENPFETIRQLMVAKTGQGVYNKVKLLNILQRLGLQIELSANHPNCKSCKYFIDKINTVAKNLQNIDS